MDFSTAARESCGFDPLLARSGPQDGQFMVTAALAFDATARPEAFIAVARDAAGEGRSRDAEVALIVACRLAARRTKSPTVPLCGCPAAAW